MGVHSISVFVQMNVNSGYGNFVLQYWQTEIEMLKCGWLLLVDSLKYSGYLPDTSSAMLSEIFNNTIGPKTEPCGVPDSALHVSKLYAVYIQWVASVSVSDLHISPRGSYNYIFSNDLKIYLQSGLSCVMIELCGDIMIFWNM